MADNTSSKINNTLQMMDYWKIQDVFHERMKSDYENGVITNPIFKFYFDWKFYKKWTQSQLPGSYHVLEEDLFL